VSSEPSLQIDLNQIDLTYAIKLSSQVFSVASRTLWCSPVKSSLFSVCCKGEVYILEASVSISHFYRLGKFFLNSHNLLIPSLKWINWRLSFPTVTQSLQSLLERDLLLETSQPLRMQYQISLVLIGIGEP